MASMAITPTPSTAALGTTTYYVSQVSTAGCESPRAAITATVNDIPAAPTVANVTYCRNVTATALTATAATGNSLLWFTAATGGTGSATAPTPSTSSAGTTTFYVSQVNANGCASPRAALTVTVLAAPAAPTVANVSYCIGETATALTATTVTGNTVLWYTTATGGTGSATAPSPSTSAVGSTTYYVSQVNANGCESPRAAITATVNALPVIGYGANYSFERTKAIATTTPTSTGATVTGYAISPT